MVGLPRAIIKKYGVTKKAWAIFRGRRKSLHSYAKKAIKKARRANIKMARRRLRGRSHRSNKSIVSAVEKIIGVAAFVGTGANRGYAVWKAEGNATRALLEGASQYAGVKDGNFNFKVLSDAWLPFIGFSVVRYGAHKIIGLIRKM